MAGLLIVNTRSGTRRPTPDELAQEAERRGLEVRTFGSGQDPGELASAADADAIGVAGGDGSIGAVAAVAIERELPFVCVPYGTRNHFARDLGLDRDDPIAALDAFGGEERRVDIARVNGRVFVNNVSLGMYARLVHHREEHRRRREVFARLRAIWIALRQHRTARGWFVDGVPVTARVLLVANNAYTLDLASLSPGGRERLDDGLLHLYAGTGVLRSRWTERAAARFTVNATRALVPAAVDGEPVELETPIELWSEPRALRVLVPPGV